MSVVQDYPARLTAAQFRALVCDTYGGVDATPPAVRQALTRLVLGTHSRLFRDQKTWYDLLQHAKA